MTNRFVSEAPLVAMKNYQILTSLDRCGCYYCLKVFSTDEITEWTDFGGTGICPYCQNDCLLPITSKETLQEANRTWFAS